MILSRTVRIPQPLVGQSGILAAMAETFSTLLSGKGAAESVESLATRESLTQNHAALEACERELLAGDFVREEWIAISRSFCRAGEEMAAVAREMESWGVAPDRFILRLAGLLREVILSVAEAAKALGPAAQVGLASAKSQSLEIQGVFRRARAETFESPSAVQALKEKEVYRRLSEAGMAMDKAIETLAWVLTNSGNLERKEGRRAN